MSTKISIFTTVGNDRYDMFSRGDMVKEAVSCYCDLADEVVIVNGGAPVDYDWPEKVRVIDFPWPYEWDWSHLPMAMNRGLEECTGDWVIRMDSDYFFHERDMQMIRYQLMGFSQRPAATFQKFVFVTRSKLYEKGPVPIAINKRLVGNVLQFGHAMNKKTDLCYPIRVTGMNDKYVPAGYYESEMFIKLHFPVYDYDYFFKTKEQTKDEFWRFSKAYHSYFGEWKFGSTRRDAFEKFTNMMRGRYNRCLYTVGDERDGHEITHSKYIKQAVSEMSTRQFAFNMWGFI